MKKVFLMALCLEMVATTYCQENNISKIMDDAKILTTAKEVITLERLDALQGSYNSLKSIPTPTKEQQLMIALVKKTIEDLSNSPIIKKLQNIQKTAEKRTIDAKVKLQDDYNKAVKHDVSLNKDWDLYNTLLNNYKVQLDRELAKGSKADVKKLEDIVTLLQRINSDFDEKIRSSIARDAIVQKRLSRMDNEKLTRQPIVDSFGKGYVALINTDPNLKSIRILSAVSDVDAYSQYISVLKPKVAAAKATAAEFKLADDPSTVLAEFKLKLLENEFEKYKNYLDEELEKQDENAHKLGKKAYVRQLIKTINTRAMSDSDLKNLVIDAINKQSEHDANATKKYLQIEEACYLINEGEGNYYTSQVPKKPITDLEKNIFNAEESLAYSKAMLADINILLEKEQNEQKKSDLEKIRLSLLNSIPQLIMQIESFKTANANIDRLRDKTEFEKRSRAKAVSYIQENMGKEYIPVTSDPSFLKERKSTFSDMDAYMQLIKNLEPQLLAEPKQSPSDPLTPTQIKVRRIIMELNYFQNFIDANITDTERDFVREAINEAEEKTTTKDLTIIKAAAIKKIESQSEFKADAFRKFIEVEKACQLINPFGTLLNYGIW